MRSQLGLAFAAATAVVLGCGGDSDTFTPTDTGLSPSAITDPSEDRMAWQWGDPGDLTEEDATGLLFMREEEKLARDVYLTFLDQFDVAVFENISGSEERHMDAVLSLILKYGLVDPVGDNGIGEFENDELQALYDALILEGSESLVAALFVGAAIEEMDILDLRERLAVTEMWDIDRVYSHLENGSENHLRAFVGQWELQTGETYVPRFLSEADYQEIMDGSGPGGGGHGHGHGQTGRRARCLQGLGQ